MQRGKQLKIYDYPLREIMFCDYCGTQVEVRSHSLKSGLKRTRYLCVHLNKKYKESSVQGDWQRNKYCDNNSSLESGPTEDTIWTTLLEVSRPPCVRVVVTSRKSNNLSNRGLMRNEWVTIHQKERKQFLRSYYHRITLQRPRCQRSKGSRRQRCIIGDPKPN